MMRIDVKAALTLAAFIRADLAAIDRIEVHASQFDLDTLSPAELDSLGYSMHNIYNALENCFKQISLGFENHVRDQARWHRELLGQNVSRHQTVATGCPVRRHARNPGRSAWLSSLVSTWLRFQTRSGKNGRALASLVD